MGTIKTTADSVFRDLEAPGSAIAHEPIKIDIRGLFGVIDTNVAAALAGASLGAVIPYATRALMYAATGVATNALGIVYADSTDAYNAVYVKTGSGSGAGNWAITALLLPTTLQTQVATLVANLGAIDGLRVGLNGEVGVDLDGLELAALTPRGLRVAGATFQWTSDALLEIATSDGLLLAEKTWTDARGFGGGDGDDGSVTPSVARRLWTGAPEPTSIKFAFDVDGDSSGVSVVEVSQDDFFTVIAYKTDPVIPSFTDRAPGTYWRSVVGKATGLTPNTAYKMRVVVDGRVSPGVVEFETLKTAGVSAGFSFVAGSCSDLVSGTVAKALEAAAAVTPRPKFMLHMGDLIYSDIDVNDIRLQRSSNSRAYRNNASASALCSAMPHVYIFDDHDFSVNDCDWDTVYPDGSTFQQIGRNTRRAIRETTPIFDPVQTPKGPPIPALTVSATTTRSGSPVAGLVTFTRSDTQIIFSFNGVFVAGDIIDLVVGSETFSRVVGSTLTTQIATNFEQSIDAGARYDGRRSLSTVIVTLRNEEFDPDRTIMAQQFDAGLVRFIIPDTRSQRRWQTGTPTCLGENRGHEYWNQTAWLRSALVQAGTDGMRRVFLVSATGWIGAVYDSWGDRFPADQAALCNYMRDTAGIPPVTILTGDFHHSAMDDGTNADKSTGGGCAIAQIMSSPLFRTPLTGGGPFSWNGVNGDMPGYSETFVEITVDDDEEFVCDFWDASTYDAVAGTPATLINSYSSTTVTPAVQFAASSSSGPASTPKVIDLVSTWFAKAGKDSRTLTYTRSDGGAGGTVTFKSNSRKATLTTNAPASGSVTITISSPVDCVLGIQTTHILTAV